MVLQGRRNGHPFEGELCEGIIPPRTIPGALTTRRGAQDVVSPEPGRTGMEWHAWQVDMLHTRLARFYGLCIDICGHISYVWQQTSCVYSLYLVMVCVL